LSGAIIVVSYVFFGVTLSTQYQTKEYEQLIEKVEKMSTEVNSVFYNNEAGVTRDAKLDMIAHMAMPEVKELKKDADKLNHLVLPYKMKKAADAQSKIVNLECQLFQQLYLEFKEQNYAKYRPAIDSLTEEVNKVRSAWAESN
jgi:hypothetical protein